jgi:HD-GYP domain-containing protein (c-di-GMP phosphodiesterase class II)
MALLLRDPGSQFDPRCVEALERVLAREDGTARSLRAPVRTGHPAIVH